MGDRTVLSRANIDQIAREVHRTTQAETVQCDSRKRNGRPRESNNSITAHRANQQYPAVCWLLLKGTRSRQCVFHRSDVVDAIVAGREYSHRPSAMSRRRLAYRYLYRCAEYIWQYAISTVASMYYEFVFLDATVILGYTCTGIRTDS